MGMPRLAWCAAALAALAAIPALAPAATPTACSAALDPPQDQRFSAERQTPVTIEDYFGSRYAGALEAARPFWLDGCRITFGVQGGYIVSSRVALLANGSAAESIRRLRATSFVMDSVERSLADQIARGALVSRGRVSGKEVLIALWRRGPALLEVTVAAWSAPALPTKTLTLFTKLQDERAKKALRG
jgi:hypothetical protein